MTQATMKRVKIKKAARVLGILVIVCCISGNPEFTKADGNDITPELIKDSISGVLPAEQTKKTNDPHPVEAQMSPDQIAALTQIHKVNMGPKEQKGSHVTAAWDNAKGGIPAQGRDGRIVYTFGATMPSVVCARYCVCDIELEEGENIRKDGIFVGDDVHFAISVTVSGPDDSLTPHIIVKPKEEVGFTTTMVVTTDRRTYYFRLGSTEDQYMARVAFSYPDAQERQRKEFFLKQESLKEAKRKKAGERDMYTPAQSAGVDKLDFRYVVEGQAPWKPTRVYNDGLKTYIEMPEVMFASEAPALIVLGAKGNEQQVNYRLQGNRYKVDYLIDKAVLIAGVGKSQTRVSISREEKRS